jgi:hypothetical protein
MKTFLLSSSGFTGEVLFRFDEAGRLVQYDVTNAALSQEQLNWFTNKLPRTLSELKNVLRASRGSVLTEQKQSAVTFDMFWDKYDEKTRSSKKRSLAKWNRMSQVQRDKAFNFIDTYFRNLLGTAPKYANTYLNDELWNN